MCHNLVDRSGIPVNQGTKMSLGLTNNLYEIAHPEGLKLVLRSLEKNAEKVFYSTTIQSVIDLFLSLILFFPHTMSHKRVL